MVDAWPQVASGSDRLIDERVHEDRLPDLRRVLKRGLANVAEQDCDRSLRRVFINHQAMNCVAVADCEKQLQRGITAHSWVSVNGPGRLPC